MKSPFFSIILLCAIFFFSCSRKDEPQTFKCGDIFIDERDENAYHTVLIGDQCWMCENLKYLPSVSPISERSWTHLLKNTPVVSRTRPYYYVYDYRGRDVQQAKATANYRNYGVLYNWPAAMTACPRGWHVPSDAEWTQLVNYMTNKFGLLNDWAHTNCVGNVLKSCRQIDSPLGGECNTTEQPRWESINTPPPERKGVSVNVGLQYGTNEVGFSALPGGRFAYGKFSELGFHGFWWSSTEYYATRAWYRFMRHEFGDVTRTNFDKAAGFCVRCIRD